MSQLGKALPYTGRTLKDCAKISSVVPLALIDDILLLFCLQLIARLFGFGPSVLDPVFLRPLFFFGARFGFAELIQIDRLNQI